MTGLETIIGQIRAPARADSDRLPADAAAQAETRITAAQAAAQETLAAAAAQTAAAVETLDFNARASAELAGRRAVLAARGECIAGVLALARQRLNSLSDGEYFSLLYGMMKKYAPQGKGEIWLNAADLKRVPADFDAQVSSALSGKNAALSLCQTPADIDGGFVLRYGDIEENCAFAALFDAHFEKLQDAVASLLFSP